VSELNQQCCKNCKFFEQIENKDVGRCRRFPPQVLVLVSTQDQPRMDPRTKEISQQRVQVQKVEGHFPLMENNSIGCGEYQNKSTPAAVGKTMHNA